MTIAEDAPVGLSWRSSGQQVRLEPWGGSAFRLRATSAASGSAGAGTTLRTDQDGALLPLSADGPAPVVRLVGENEAGRRSLINGRLAVEVDLDRGGRVVFRAAATGAELLAEAPPDDALSPAHRFEPVGGGLYQIHASFRAYPGERLYGLGQHQHGRLDQKGLVLELRQRNTEVSIPFLLSSRGYGLLWNNPALGCVSAGERATEWRADAAPQLDYWVSAGSPSELLRSYADGTGHAPPFPAWAAGLWQSRLRYKDQHEALAVAREYQRRGLPLAVIVIDALHWTLMGEWRFDESEWPDPSQMVRELESLGVRVMVSVWPTVNRASAYCAGMRANGWLVKDLSGAPARSRFIDRRPSGLLDLHLLDATHPGARRFLWERLREGYYRHGIRLFWLDADEPEMEPLRAEDLLLAEGPGSQVANLYPLRHAQAVYEGLLAEGETEVLTLNRSAWAGSQRFGAAVWSGDIEPTWRALRAQIPAGLSAALSGLPWWTSDIGGFHGGDPDSPEYRELLIRWFQFGVFCPILRMHGFREPMSQWAGGPNELWSFGEQAYAILREQLLLRERLRPRLLAAMQCTHETGLPPMRPLWVDFPDDPLAWEIEDAYLFCDDLLVAPVAEPGVVSRRVYLPAGCSWREEQSARVFPGGQWVTLDAPLERIPFLVRQ